MPTVKISDLSATTTITGTEVLPIVQSGTTKQITANNFVYKFDANSSGSFLIPTNTATLTTTANTGSVYYSGSKLLVFTGKGTNGWQTASLGG